MVETCDNELTLAYEKSELPAKADYDKINKMLIDINKKGLAL